MTDNNTEILAPRPERRRAKRAALKAAHREQVRVNSLLVRHAIDRRAGAQGRPKKARAGTFADWVISTHRTLPDGSFQEDPRDGKYLHSHARAMRGLRKAIGQRAA